LGLAGRDITLIAVLTAIPLLGYQFGMGNQVEQFTIIERLRDPNFLAGDFYTDSASQFGPRYYYSLLLSWFTAVASLPVVVFVLTCLVNFALAWVTVVTARARLGAAAAGAAVAAALVIANSSFPLGLAGYIRFESFQPASLAIPLSLIGFVWLADGRRFSSVAAFSAAALFHPLIGAEVAFIAFASAGLADLLARKPIRTLIGYVPAGAALFAFLVLAWALPSMSTEKVSLSSEEFISILPAFRSPHHYLGSTFPFSHYQQLAAFVAAVALLFVHARRDNEHPRLLDQLVLAAGIVLAMCAASLVLVDVLHNGAAATAQFFRMLFVVKWIGFLLFGLAAGRWLATGRPLFMVAPFLVLIATGEAQAYVMLAATIAVLVAERFAVRKAFEVAVAVALALLAFYLTAKIGAREEAARAAIAGVGIGLLYLAPLALPVAAVTVVGMTVALIAFGWFNRHLGLVDRGIFRPTYGWDDVRTDEADIARWIRTNTPGGATWITPPQFESFRLLAERPIVVDFTSIPFEGEAMREWRRRIRSVYGDVQGGGFVALQGMDRNYRSITPQKLSQLSAEFNAPFAVIYRDTPWPARPLYENREYKAVSLRGPLPSAR
jgi:hypothetical protein